MRWRYGGSIDPSGSHFGWWTHFYWISNDGRRFEFAPPKHVAGMKRPPLRFRGRPQELLSETVIRKVRVNGRVKTETIQK